MIFWIIVIIAWLVIGFVAAIFVVDPLDDYTENIKNAALTILCGPVMGIVILFVGMSDLAIKIRKWWENKHAEKGNNEDM